LRLQRVVTMEKLILLSMLVATVAVPAFTARISRGDRALAMTLVLVLVSSLVYVFLLTQLYARDYVPEPFLP
jgi:hypothetical protein